MSSKNSPRRLVLLLVLVAVSFCASGQADQWAWMYGDKTPNVPTDHGDNHLGGRHHGVGWTDKEGNLWYFGGFGNNPSGVYGDLWKYNKGTNQWVFININGTTAVNHRGGGTKGVPSPNSRPMARDRAVSWVDKSGNLWLFGGSIIMNGNPDYVVRLNDLWKFNPGSGQWTWVGGEITGDTRGVYKGQGRPDPDNMPGSRAEAVSWTDAEGKFWLFGGYGIDNRNSDDKLGFLNDLWKYDPETNLWTWVSGSPTRNANSEFGEKGASSSSYQPGARNGMMGWSDGRYLWLFGGYGPDGEDDWGRLNDLWRFDTRAEEWAWVGGTKRRNDDGFYHQKGKALPDTRPPGRAQGVTWYDGQDLWLYGGYHTYDHGGRNSELYNDLWRFSPVTGMWTWVSGDASRKNTAVYGNKGSFAPQNHPGGLAGAVSWFSDGKLWLFGGHIYYPNSIRHASNDLWAFNPGPCTAPAPGISPLNGTLICDPVRLTATGGSSYQWLLNGATIAGATAATYEAKAPGVYRAIVYSGTSCHTVTQPATIAQATYTPAFASTLSAENTSLCTSPSVVLRINYDKSGPTHLFRWYKDGVLVPGASGETLTVSTPGTYTAQQSYCANPYSNIAGSVTVSGPVRATATTTAANCGQPTGTATVTGTGGMAPYAYRLGDGPYGSSGRFTGLAAGQHTVTVQDKGGCTFAVTFTVDALPSTVSATPNITPTTCGLPNGAVALAASGGTGSYTYAWTGPNGYTANTPEVRGLAAGTYRVVITDAAGCTFTLNPEVAQSVNTLNATAAPTDASCGLANGTVRITATGGSPDYTYRLDQGTYGTSPAFTGLSAGAHTVTVRDKAGCTTDVTFTITNANSSLSATPAVTDVSCAQRNGAIQLTVRGGSAPYTFAWSGPDNFRSTSQHISGLAAGTYQVVVRDNEGCQLTLRPEVKPGPPALLVSAAPNPALCGGANGSVSISASGGTAPYSYRLGNGAYVAAATFNGLSAGTYRVTVKDFRECTAEVSFTIVSNNSSLAAVPAPVPTTCGQNNGAITLAVTGSNAPFTYTWTGPGGFRSSERDVSGLVAGTYQVVIKDNAGCQLTLNPEVKQGPPAVTATAETTNAACGQANGSVRITASGGTAPYSYRLNSGNYGTASRFTGLAAGQHTVTVRDNAGCTFVVAFTIGAANSTLSATAAVTPTTCGRNNGAIGLTVNGGTAPYSYSWTGPGGFTAAGGSISGLATGSYKAEITDASGCRYTVNAEVKEGAPALSARAATTAVSCNTSGSATITPTGGTAPYSYSLGNGAFGASPTFTGLATGTYKVTVRDQTNCTAEVSFTITAINSTLAATSSIGNVTCGQNNGTIGLTVSGGSAPYTFAWSGPGNFSATTEDVSGLRAGTYTVVIKDAAGCQVTLNPEVRQSSAALTASVASITNAACGQANGSVRINVGNGSAPYSYSLNGGAYGNSASFTGLAAGIHTVAVRDVTGCTAEVSFTIGSLNSTLAATAAVTDALCEQKNGAINLSVSGGNAPFIFNWSGPAGFTATTQNLSSLAAGNYRVDITDNLGCRFTLHAEVKQAASALTATARTTDIACGSTSGSVTVTPGGGTAPYAYSVDGGAFGASPTINGLSAGAHKVTVRDAGGCTVEVPFTISGDGRQPNLVITNPAPLCTNTTANLTAAAITAGSDPGLVFTYWTDAGATAPVNNPSAVAAGTYYIKGTGANGCAAIKAVQVAISTTPAGTITPAAASICTGGSAPLTASSGKAYQWYYNGTVIQGANQATFTATQPGSYNVFISDGNCMERASNTVVVTQTAIDTAIRALGSTAVCGGTVQLQAGTATTYQWYRDGVQLEGAVSALYVAAASGKYRVSVTNQQGCAAFSREVEVSVLQKPVAEFSFSVSCEGTPVSFTNLTNVANSGAVSYLWTFGPAGTSNLRTPSHVFSAAGTYEVTLTVTPGACPQNSSTVTKTVRVEKTIAGTTYGVVNATAGVPYALEAREVGIGYNWTPATGLDNPQIRAPKVTTNSDRTYIIEILSASGCITRDTQVVKVQHAEVNVYVPTAFTPNGNRQNDKLRPVLFNVPQLTYFKVYNRWGQLVYQTSQPGEGWDGMLKGQAQPAESYTWVLECVDLNGRTIKKAGASLLIR